MSAKNAAKLKIVENIPKLKCRKCKEFKDFSLMENGQYNNWKGVKGVKLQGYLHEARGLAGFNESDEGYPTRQIETKSGYGIVCKPCFNEIRRKNRPSKAKLTKHETQVDENRDDILNIYKWQQMHRDAKNRPKFEFVCAVKPGTYKGDDKWEIDDLPSRHIPNVLFSEHESWVYIIVANGRIQKLGETGAPLGKPLRSGELAKSDSRFARIFFHRDKKNPEETDSYIRSMLTEEASAGKVEIFAWAVPYTKSMGQIGYGEKEIVSTAHKSYEKRFLEFIMDETESYPPLNKGRA